MLDHTRSVFLDVAYSNTISIRSASGDSGNNAATSNASGRCPRRGEIVLKIFASSLNLPPTPPPGQIFNAHPLDFLNANFDVPERYYFAAYAACNIMIRPRVKLSVIARERFSRPRQSHPVISSAREKSFLNPPLGKRGDGDRIFCFCL